MFGIRLNSNGPSNAQFTGNQITIPASVTAGAASGGINVIGHVPVTNAILNKNVSLTTAPIFGYRFSNSGDPANLNLDMGFDNFGSSTRP